MRLKLLFQACQKTSVIEGVQYYLPSEVYLRCECTFISDLKC